MAAPILEPSHPLGLILVNRYHHTSIEVDQSAPLTLAEVKRWRGELCGVDGCFCPMDALGTFGQPYSAEYAALAREASRLEVTL